MKLFYFFAVCIFTLFSSCNNHQPVPENKPVETPKVLQGNNSNAESSFSLSKRSPNDLVEQLYNELLEKNTALSALEKGIEKIKEDSKDSALSFNDFDNKNDSYYQASNRHMDGIQDSVLKNRIKLLISNSIAKYKSNIAAHTDLLAIIDKKDRSLDDLHIVLKLSQTLHMIEQYQSAGLPSLKPLTTVSKTYDKLIEKTDALSKQ